MDQKYAPSALSGSRSAATFALQMIRDKERKLELAQRMYEAWEQSGHTQEAVAQAVGLKHRSFQKALQTGGISYEKLEKLAQFTNVDFDWLRTGRKVGETPDLATSLNGDVPELRPQLDRIEQTVEQILEILSPADADDEELLPPAEDSPPDVQDDAA